jgi:hypothetical protein
MFLQVASGIPFSSGLRQFRMVGLGYSGRGDGATISDNLNLNTNAPSLAGDTVLRFNSLPSSLTVGMGVSGTNIPAGNNPASVASISGNDVTLTVPVTGSGVANGVPIRFSGGGWFLGGGATAGICERGLNDPNGCSARIATVSAGANCVTLLDPTISSRFTGTSFGQVTGNDMQGFGFPPNAYFYEYVTISSVDASHQCDGVTAGASVHLSGSLTNSYKSTWPV